MKTPRPGRGAALKAVTECNLDAARYTPPRLALQPNAPKTQRDAEHLVTLGARAVLEALRQVENGETLDSVLAAYGRLDRRTVCALGGDRFPPLPVHEVVR